MKQFKFESGSEKGVYHTVTLHDDDHLTCSCRGFRTPSKCWHVKDVATKEGLNVVIGGEVYGDVNKLHQEEAKPVQKPLIDLAPTIPVHPMLAKGLKEGQTIEDFMDDDHVMEEKYDGHRMIIEVGPEITAWARSGNVRLLARHIRAALKVLAPGIYDGELCIPGGTSTDVTALDLIPSSELKIFDILRHENHSTMTMTYWNRHRLLEEIGKRIVGISPVEISPQFEVSRIGLQKIWDVGGEGAIIKRTDSIYEETRSKAWIKLKKEQRVACTIAGFVVGLLGPHSKISCYDAKGVEVQVKTLNDEWRRVFATKAALFIGKEIFINYQNQTATGKYRHPMADHITGFEEIAYGQKR